MNLLETYKTLENNLVKIKHNPQLDLYNINYLQASESFDNPLVMMARGLVLDKDGQIIIRGFKKFFNYKQLETKSNYNHTFKSTYTYLHKANKYKAYEKLDGTCILVGNYKDNLLVTTLGSTDQTSQYIKAAKQLLLTMTNVPDLVKRIKGATLIFEYTAPDNQIVVPYDKPNLTLLGLVDNKTGKETLADELDMFTDFPKPKIDYFTYEQLKTLMNESKEEGVIVVNDKGHLIKFKTEYWFKNHHTRSTLRPDLKFTLRNIRTLLEAYANGQFDDLYGYVNQHNLSNVQIYLSLFEHYIKTFNKAKTYYLDKYIHLTNKEISQLAILQPFKNLLYNAKVNKFNRDNYLLSYLEEKLKILNKPIVHVLVGPPASGKSSFTKDKQIVYSSDKIRATMPEYEDIKIKHQRTFATIHNCIKEDIKLGLPHIYFDATNISRKRRHAFYQEVKQLGANVMIHVFHAPYETLLVRDKQRHTPNIPEAVITDMYKNMIPPKQGLDCDQVLYHGATIDQYTDEMQHRIDEAHNSPYHVETLREHIAMTVEKADDDLKDIAIWHDTGKAFTRTPVPNWTDASNYIYNTLGKFDTYKQHPNVSAMYYFIANAPLIEVQDKVTLDNLEVILYHMLGHQQLSHKTIKKCDLSPDVIDKITRFSKVDEAARIIDAHILTTYNKLKELST